MNVELAVNYTPVNVQGFVQRFMGNVVIALVNSLNNSGTEGDIKLSVKDDNVDISVDGSEIQMKAFVGDFVRNTVIGMVSSLKGVEQIDSLDINIARQG